MMNSRRGRKWACLLLGGSLMALPDKCLPEDYFAFSARGVAVALANTLVATAVSPLFNAINDITDGSNDNGS